MRNCLDVSCSFFNRVHSTEHDREINLFEHFTQKPDEQFIQIVNDLRSEPNKEIRGQLKTEHIPAITPSGIHPDRKETTYRNGLICLDIDRSSNLHIENWTGLKNELSKITQVAIVSSSISGPDHGYFVFIPVSEPNRHDDHWISLQKDFYNHFSIVIDPKPKRINAMRFCSYDPDLYINPSADRYKRIYKKITPVIRQIKPASHANSIQRNVDLCIQEILKSGIDITGDYNQWISIGFSLASEFGEAGRDMFHQVSQFHPTYNYQICDRQFTNCIKSNYNNTIDPFFSFCKDHGILFKQHQN